MKKKGLLTFAIVMALVFAGCSGEKGKTVGMTIGNPSGNQGIFGETENPTVTMSPEQKELAKRLRIVHEDDISARLVEQGYYYEVDQSCSNSMFQIDLKAVTGDMARPMLAFDVYVNNAEMAAKYEELKLYAYIWGEEEKNNRSDLYPPCEGIGKADEQQKNLFHVMMPEPSAWLSMGEPVVVDICQVDFVYKSGRTQTYHVDMPEMSLTVPQTKLYPVLNVGDTGVTLTYKGVDFVLTNAEYGKYETILDFECLVDKTMIYIDPNETEYFVDENFQLIWEEFLSKVELEVDGKTYFVNADTYLTFCEKGGTKEQYRGGGIAKTTGVNFAWAKEAIIWVGTVGYDLKSGSKTPLTRELPTPTPAPAMKPEQKELAEHLRNKCKDEISADLVEQGYYHIVNETRETESLM